MPRIEIAKGSLVVVFAFSWLVGTFIALWARWSIFGGR